jgi:hypothetical protein
MFRTNQSQADSPPGNASLTIANASPGPNNTKLSPDGYEIGVVLISRNLLLSPNGSSDNPLAFLHSPGDHQPVAATPSGAFFEPETLSAATRADRASFISDAWDQPDNDLLPPLPGHEPEGGGSPPLAGGAAAIPDWVYAPSSLALPFMPNHNLSVVASPPT